MATKAHIEGNKRYLQKFEEIKIRVPKGEKESLKTYANSKGMSLNEYINNLIKTDKG